MVAYYLMILIVLLTIAFGAPRDHQDGFYGHGMFCRWYLTKRNRHVSFCVNVHDRLWLTVQNY